MKNEQELQKFFEEVSGQFEDVVEELQIKVRKKLKKYQESESFGKFESELEDYISGLQAAMCAFDSHTC